MKTINCSVCGAQHQVQETPTMPIPAPPPGSSYVSLSVAGAGAGLTYWVIICKPCADRFRAAMNDPVVSNFANNILPWVVKQSFELKIAIDRTRAKIHPEN